MITMKPLSYDTSLFNESISQKTWDCHYHKHYATYVKNTNDLIQGTQLSDKNIFDIVQFAQGKNEYQKLFNNAAQVFNHEFFWDSLSPNEDEHHIPSALLSIIERDFQSLENFYDTFNRCAGAQFGSGWVWLVSDNGVLKIVSTGNADIPSCQLLACVDVWEHAYYLDYQNRRLDFVDYILRHVFNWRFVWENYQR